MYISTCVNVYFSRMVQHIIQFFFSKISQNWYWPECFIKLRSYLASGKWFCHHDNVDEDNEYHTDSDNSWGNMYHGRQQMPNIPRACYTFPCSCHDLSHLTSTGKCHIHNSQSPFSPHMRIVILRKCKHLWIYHFQECENRLIMRSVITTFQPPPFTHR